ncbi:hypothetical protein EG68_03183 [Paragonimus skrjabini miyazakii]|uniref:Uncharacterized protein n=1 Tax=Paragonimus skrjabini miyazakii TaxID=59628 RepID=A0A8S9Z8I8_9TREM|nr:hypothetical protein EG68_03183 [Paragonimus skrjabini miyazakii]
MKRFCCLFGLTESSLNRRLRRLAEEQDDPAATSNIVTDEIPVAVSADCGITVVDAAVVDCESQLTIAAAGNVEGLPTVELQSIVFGSRRINFSLSQVPLNIGRPAN